MIAVTGATGFVGQVLLRYASDQHVYALTRRPQADAPGVTWVSGDLADTDALTRLCTGANAVIHIAGVVNARDRAGFDAGNVTGTANLLAAAHAAGVRRFVHVSSIAAREPLLSMYGASKAEGERLVTASGLDWVIVRPPGVYGPGDTEMLDFYRLAARGWALVPPGRFPLIHVDDLARALLALASGGPSHTVLEIDDGRGGYSHGEFSSVIGAALGTRIRTVSIPPAALSVGAAFATIAARLGGTLPKLSFDRARYLAHPDWVGRGGNAAMSGIWEPAISLRQGVADTVAGYRAKGWL